MAGSTDGIRFLTDGDEWDPEAHSQSLASDIATRNRAMVTATTNARSQADLALDVARQAHEVPAVKARVDAPIPTVSNQRGSVALDRTVIARPQSGRLSGSPTRCIAAVAGVYRVGGAAEWAAVPSGSGGSTGARLAQMRLNAAGSPTGGTAVGPVKRIDPNGATHAPYLALSPELVELAAGQFVELFVEQGQGSGVNVTSGTFLELEFVRPLT